jgi:hypothetical protein
MRDTIEKKLTATDEIEITESGIIGGVKGGKDVDESTRRDINITGRSTGFTYQPGINESTIDNLINEAETSVSNRGKKTNFFAGLLTSNKKKKVEQVEEEKEDEDTEPSKTSNLAEGLFRVIHHSSAVLDSEKENTA